MLGISPFNSRFSDDYVARLLAWASRTGAAVDVLLAGDETSRLLEATGVPEGRARRKSRAALARNRRAVDEARQALPGFSCSVYSLSDFAGDATYLRLRREAEQAFDRDPGFRRACLDMARRAVEGRLRGTGVEMDVCEDRIRHASEYVLAEMPLFVDTPAVLGVGSSLLVYHQPWSLGARILAGEFPVRMGPTQGYLVVDELLVSDNEMVA